MLLRFCLLLLFIPAILHAKPVTKSATAVRTPVPPVMDGQLDEHVWLLADPITEFRQYDPVFAAQAGQATEVRILYDDKALYIGARLYDSAPDSILTQLGNRDDGLNADLFGIQFDTYYNGLDAYIFEVYASGVQRDSRRSDYTFNAVWESAVAIDQKGWTMEMRIPWSALRFPGNGKQVWGLQVHRSIRRHREMLQWALVPKGASNTLAYWGELHGLRNIDPPLRLSFTPYVSAMGEHYPYNTPGSSNYSSTFSGGMDLKYGINESFTLDMTLMPDFSTVASDHEIKNLSAFETVYGENREFFKEGVDLFHKGGLFYSRRIGGKPQGYAKAGEELLEGEFIQRNPDKAQLINASKISGRTSGNLGVGVFNAMTSNTYAIAEDSLGRERAILTGPFTNYNILVLDQGLNFNSSAYLINTNVTRAHGFDNENVTAGGITYFESSNTHRFHASGKLSQIYPKNDNNNDEEEKNTDLGYRYDLGAAKVKGQFHFNLWFTAMDDSYNINGMGLNHRNNSISNGAWFAYNIYEPFWLLNRFSTNISINNSSRMSTGKNTGRSAHWRINGTFNNYLTIWAGLDQSLNRSHDYYEPRVNGRFYINPLYSGGNINFSSDYRKPFALDGGFSFSVNENDHVEKTFTIKPIVRFSDQFTLDHRLRLTEQENDRGYVSRFEGDVIFGNRELKTIENTLSSRYMFRNNLSLGLWMRHYWFRGNYNNFYTLQEDGLLARNTTYMREHDFNFNTFNIDLMFEWEFAPGSNLSVVYKNAIMHEETNIVNNFFDNFGATLDAPQLNSITVKLIYYLDYQSLQRKRRSDHRQDEGTT
jgi:hypothetical protein